MRFLPLNDSKYYLKYKLIVVHIDTVVGPLGRCVGASDHAMFVCSVGEQF